MSRIRASSLPSQALLMQQRGDLRGTSARFRVQLDKPSPVTIHADPIARIGMEVKRDSSRSRLLIEDVDENPRQRTPIAQWNTAEERQADRGEEEKHCSMAIKPGDRIKAVNDLNSATLMLSELQEAAKPDDPRQLSLEVSRDISNVLAPAPQKLRVNSAELIGPKGMCQVKKMPARRFAAAWALATPWLAFIASDRSASRLALHAKKGPDVRALLESAGLLPPKPTETWLPEEEAEFETPLDQLRQSIEQNLIRPNVETLVPEGEIEFETPLDSLQKLNASSPLEWLTQSLPRERLVEEGEEMAFQTPLSFLFQEDEDFEEEEIWSDLLAPLLKGPAVVDTMNESNYVTVSLEKPLGMTVEENSKIFGGVSVVGLEEGSRAEGLGLIEPGWQLLMADGVP
ncbi:unnamed protein product, partial [Effrenium voratum]